MFSSSSLMASPEITRNSLNYGHNRSVSVLLKRHWVPILMSAVAAALVLAVVVTPAPLNLLRARLSFTVESVSFDAVIVDGDERTHFQASISYENLGPVKVETMHNLLFAALSEEGGILFDTMNDYSSAMESGEVRTIAFNSQVTGFWDSAMLWVKASVHDVFGSSDTTGYFWLDRPLILEI